MCEDEFMKDETATPLDMMKALGDPIRLRIIAALGVPRTVKQVGDYLEMDASKLYYHVKELYRVGLVDLVETRVVGGVAEKYYRAVERTIDEAAQKEFAELAEKEPERVAELLLDAVNSILASVLTEFSWYSANIREFEDRDLAVTLTEGFVDLTPEKAAEVARTLGELVPDAKGGGGEDTDRYCLAAFLFPMRPKD